MEPKKDTQWLGSQLVNIHSEEAMDENIEANQKHFKNEFTAGDYFLQCLSEHNVTMTEINRALKSNPVDDKEFHGKPIMDRTLVSHFIGGRKNLSRDQLIILSILGKLTLKELEVMFKYAGYRQLYEKDSRDVMLKYALGKASEYDSPLELYKDIEYFLKEQHQAPLCSKLDNPFEPQYNPNFQNETETVLLRGKLEEVKTPEDLQQYVEMHKDDMDSANSLRMTKVSDYIKKCCQTKGLSIDKLIHDITDCYLDESTTYHLLHINQETKTIKPFTRNNIIAIGIIAGLHIKQINQALKLNGNQELYARDQRDYCLMYCILEKYSYLETEEFLQKHDLAPLYKEKKQSK